MTVIAHVLPPPATLEPIAPSLPPCVFVEKERSEMRKRRKFQVSSERVVAEEMFVLTNREGRSSFCFTFRCPFFFRFLCSYFISGGKEFSSW
jgi:hypothetical protein